MSSQDFDHQAAAVYLLNSLRGIGLERAFAVALDLTFQVWQSERGTDASWELMVREETPDLVESLAHKSDGLRTLRNFAGALPEHNLTEAFAVVESCREASGAGGLRELGEALVGSQLRRADLGVVAHASPKWTADLMSELIGPVSSAVDPVCGMGSTLLALARRGSRVLGFDISDEASRIAKARLTMSECDFIVEQRDSIARASDLPTGQDAVVASPPFGVKLGPHQVHGMESAGVSPTLLRGRAANAGLYWLDLASHMLSDSGRAAVVLSSSASRASGALEELVDRRMIEAVIALPPGALLTTSVQGELWLLTAEGAGPANVLVADIGSYATTDNRRRRTDLSPAAIEAVRTLVETFRSGAELEVPGHVARVVPVAERRADDGLSPRRMLEPAPQLPEVLPEPSGHLLNSLSVSGYKAFANETDVPLGALTLVYGPNSSGKSSLIQSLLLIKQSIDSGHLVTQGTLSDVGSFIGVRNKHDAPAVEFGFTFGAPVWDLPAEGTPDPTHPRRLGFRFTDSGDGRGGLEAAQVEAGPLATQWVSASEDRRSASTSSLSDAFAEIATGTFLFGRDSRQIFDDEDPDRDRKRRVQGRSQARRLERDGLSEVEVEWLGLLPSGRPPVLPSHVGDERNLSTAQSYLDRLSRLIAGVGLEFRSLLDGLVYLGPLRSAPQRFYSRADGAGQPGDGRDAFLFLYDNSSAVEQVNTWFKELEIPYEVDVVPIHAAAAPGLVGDLVAVSLRDLRSDVVVTPADVGYGISQAIPIVVELTARSHSIVCIEQPETHLHPRLQARLGDLLIDATNPEGRANQLIVETHSEHLMLRVQRRIREDDIDAGDVCVLYVDQNEDGSARVQRLRLDEDGDFVDEWPDGFFDERMEELFGGLL